MSEMHPFVKWAGGKSQILDKLILKCPKTFNCYYEPFIGGGALFFKLQPNKSVINDSNKELMDIFKCFKNDRLYRKMISIVDKYQQNHNEENYYKIRDLDKSKFYKFLPIYEKAARTLYLNKACFNGLYRVNSKGFFNVPFNGKDKINCYEKENMESISTYFKKTKPVIMAKDFEKCLETCKKGDFVYLDPPYDTYENKKSFTTYTKDNFGKDEQKRLSLVFRKLSEKGVHVMASNHNTDYVNELYKGFNIEVIEARRSINAKGDGRGKVEEVIITNY